MTHDPRVLTRADRTRDGSVTTNGGRPTLLSLGVCVRGVSKDSEGVINRFSVLVRPRVKGVDIFPYDYYRWSVPAPIVSYSIISSPRIVSRTVCYSRGSHRQVIHFI